MGRPETPLPGISTWQLVKRSLVFHARSHIGVVIGAAVAGAALVGALVMGDSVRGTLRDRALEGLGTIAYALSSPDRFLTEGLSLSMPGSFRNSWRDPDTDDMIFYGEHPAGILLFRGMVSREDESARANQVNVVGLDFDPGETANWYVGFWDFYPGSSRTRIEPGEVWLNESLAGRLGVKPGDSVVLRLPKPGALSPETAIGTRENSVALRLRVAGIRAAKDFGNFSLRPTQTAPLNAFINLGELQQSLGLGSRVNTLLSYGVYRDSYKARDTATAWLGKIGLQRWAERISVSRSRVPVSEALAAYADDLKWRASLEDYEASLVQRTNVPGLELRSRQVFLDPPLVKAGLQVDSNALPVLTYLANLMVAGTNATAYSMVTAAGPPWTPAELAPDEIVLNRWLAEDLKTKPGETVALVYFEPESGARLVERTNIFRVHSIVPMELPWADRTLMPDFPGIEKAERASDWDAGFPLVHKIRPKDEDYWKNHRGTPKAFVSLATGRKLWGNRFGDTTAMRFASAVLTKPEGENAEDTGLARQLVEALEPAEFGLRFEPVQAQALQAAAQSQDFGGLFIGFSFFLITAALVLMALLFRFALEQRTTETGTLLALGFTPRFVRRLYIAEGGALVILGALLGVVAGLLYAKALLHGLSTIWRDAVAQSALNFHASAVTLAAGFGSTVLVAVFTLFFSLRKQARQPAYELLAGKLPEPLTTRRTARTRVVFAGRARLLAPALTAIGLGIAAWAIVTGQQANAGAFFGAGAALLLAGFAWTWVWFGKQRDGSAHRLSLARLALRGCARRRSRSLATVALLACASFLIISISVFRLESARDALNPRSGTGGFGLIAESTVPIVEDLTSPSGLDALGVNPADLEGVRIVPLRVRQGDEASCLNLNRAQQPRLLGVDPKLLAGRFNFSRSRAQTDAKDPWRDLTPSAPDEVPAIGDANSIQWAMGKKVGDTIAYVDGRGRAFRVRIVGAVANSILQGNLLIDEREFIKRFPNESGYRTFLIDAPPAALQPVSEKLARALQDYGVELTPALQRLNAFNAVQNTYLGTFQVLGGLGLLLGSAGLGIVVLRNVLERRGELGLLVAVGFEKKTIGRLVLGEHAFLLLLGIVIGSFSAGVAVLPAIIAPATPLPYATIGITLAAVLLNGLLWTWLATRFSLRGELLAALRNEQ